MSENEVNLSTEIFATEITMHGVPGSLVCDGNCHKAWGIESRPESPNSLQEDDFEWLADGELDEAPVESGVLEGGDDKPKNLLEAHNRWCARQCERSVFIELGETAVLPDFSKRVQN